ncbi:NAD(P)/FAD-dependent oxidoreductase [Capillimicrobium parvum]|uniref:Anthranilate 1,2-dioxygenase system ferredoxin--NAD(+) reductase component n=1 Tax=Capillimicrobium parvum TaxID=2884022 RepID=A0A9E6Y302_9ACTN|nr:FAD-dependent oxidoreductase [Capillimicrobium parvum]UGS38958.1 Anthranilate 1,2-dioxygenase system ferredoxin--NAD(+) reductase component [Capillimicrobium parvum]
MTSRTTTGSTDGIVVAGGGLAAQRACETLRRAGHDGPIRVVCGEQHAPYDRPPLSKEFLAGELGPDELRYRPDDWYREQEVDLLLGERAARLDAHARRLALDGGAVLRYDRLLIATGSEPRRLPGVAGRDNVHELRTLADAQGLREAIAAGRRLAVVGAGFIGQEVAAGATRAGARVTIVEAAAAPLAAILGEELGGWFARLHREEGVEVLLSARIARLHGGRGVEAIELEDGRRIDCDAVVVGIGTQPATGWLAGSGLDPAGVLVDGAGRTVAPGVFAAGDASRPFDARLGVHLRTEHWEAAARQGAAAARAMLGLPVAASPAPSFWSDQHGVRIQYVGHAHGADGIEIDGDPGARDFTATFTASGRPVAALLVGRPHALPALRRRLEAHHDERTAA